MKLVGDTLSFSKVENAGAMHTVKIPIYHRTSVGLFPGTTVFAVPLPSTNEIVLTSIDPARWGDLWRLEATVADQPGAAKTLVETLVKHNVNVLVHEGVSESVKEGKTVHHVFEILDLADYADDLDGTSEVRNSVGKSMLKPNRLVNRLVGHSADCLAQAHELNDWDLRFERMEFFFRNKDARVNAVELNLNVDNEVHVPVKLLRELVCGGDAKEPLPLHIISDTEQKYVKLRVLSPDKYYVLFEIEHAEQVGAIDEFLGVFKSRKANIIDSYSRLKSIAHSALFYALAEFEGRMTKGKVDAILKDLIGSSLARAVVLKGAVGHGPVLENLALPKDVSIRAPASKRSKAKRDAPLQRRAEAPEEPESASNLGAPFYLDRRGSGSWTLNTAQVFMAIPFSEAYREFYDDYVAEPVKEAGLEPIRVDRLPAQGPRRLIIERIEEGIARSRFVIADISNWNPNVMYEVGLADGISKPMLILCDSRHFDAKEIPLDQQAYELIKYSPYKANGLRMRLAEKIEQLKEDTDPAAEPRVAI